MSETSLEIHVVLITWDTPRKHVGTEVLNFALCVCVGVCGMAIVAGHTHRMAASLNQH